MLRSLAGGALFGECWGTAPAQVVALHGWRRTHSDFARVLGPSSAGGPLPTVAPDLPGFGATAAPPGPWGSGDYAELVAELIRGPDGTEAGAVIVGHSLGGRVGATLAARYPELVRALVLTGAPLVARTGPRRRPPFAYRTVRLLRRLRILDEARVEKARQRYGSEDYRNAQGIMREVLVRLVNESYEEVLASIRCPVELVWGSEDSEVPLSVAHAIQERLERSNSSNLTRLTECRGAGHLLPLDRPAELRAAVERAMGSATSSATRADLDRGSAVRNDGEVQGGSSAVGGSVPGAEP